MTDATTHVRADIEATRERMSDALSALERKVDIAQKVRDNPWPAVAIAFGAGLVLSATRADARAGRAGVEGVRNAGSSVGSALDDVFATLVGGVTGAFKDRINEALHDVIASVSGAGDRDGTTDDHARREVSGAFTTPSRGHEITNRLAGRGAIGRAD